MPALATITALTAKPGVQQIELTATVGDPNANGLPYVEYKDVEFVCSEVNDRNDVSAEVIGTERSSVTHTGQPEEIIHYFWARPRFSYVRAGATIIYYGDYYPSSPTAGVPARALGMAGLIYAAANAYLVIDDNTTDAAVAAGDLRIALKTKAGNDPSPDDPVYLAVPGTTPNQAGYEIEAIAYAVSMTLPSGTTLGTELQSKFPAAGLPEGTGPFSVWVLACINRAGANVWQIGVINPRAPGFLADAIVNETGDIYTDKTIPPGDIAGALYVADDVAGEYSHRILARLVWDGAGLTVPGEWELPDTAVMYQRGNKQPGEVSRKHTKRNTDVSQHTTVIPYDGTTPVPPEGEHVTTAVFGMESSANWMHWEFEVVVSTDVDDHVIVYLMDANVGDDILVAKPQFCKAGMQVTISGSTAPVRSIDAQIGVELHVGPATTGTTVTINGVGGAGKLNTATIITGTEIAG